MGKSLKGKELGVGISQRKDGTYQARFTNRSGKRETIYDKKLSVLRRKLAAVQYEDADQTDDVSGDMTLDEWFDIWIDVCKRNCRNSSIATYTTYYKRLKKDLGCLKLSALNLITMQRCINSLSSDNKRKTCKALLVDMLDKAVDSDLLVKNVARRLNTTITKEPRREKRVLTVGETEIFMEMAKDTRYYNLYVLALETGMRVGELCALQWSDIDLDRRKLDVKRTLLNFYIDGKWILDVHDTKTESGNRTIPLTSKAVYALKRQRAMKKEMELKGVPGLEGFDDIVFFTRDNKPLNRHAVQKSMDYVIRNIRKNCEFERFTPHTFRHTFATRAIERGMNPKTLQRILGHAKLQMTMDLYCHVTDDTLFSEMRKFEIM